MNKLIVKIWKIIDDMTPEELADSKLQTQFIKMFWDVLSSKEPSKPIKDKDVRDCRTLEEFLIMIDRYKVDVNLKIMELEKHGVKVERKKFLLTHSNDSESDKKEKTKKSERNERSEDAKNEKNAFKK